MKCPDFEILMLMLDGELPEDQLKEVTDHVESCRECRKIISSQEHIETSWRDSFRSPDDDRFRAIEQQLFDKINHHSSWKWWTAVPIAAGIAVVLLGVKFILSEKPSIEIPSGYSMYESEANRTITEHLEDSFYQIAPEAGYSIDSVTSEAPLETQPIQFTDVSVETDTHSRISGIGYGSDADREISGAVSGGGAEMQTGASGTAQGGEELLGASASPDEISESLDVSARGSGGLLHEDYYFEEGTLEETEEIMSHDDRISEDGLIFSLESSCGEIHQEESEVETVLSPDMDTTGLKTVSSIPASSIEDRTEEIIGIQTIDGIMPADEVSSLWRDSEKLSNIELVFDINGEPDSMTALLLDSLIPEWYLYIPFIFRDTTLIIQRDGIYEYFVNVNTAPACENE
ncbi:MAG: zf-HC2 domain-containing protein [Candidatus Aegiribacteria sp.]|nr:zf-HC2 domain-containing protein [Candidatus Aegiribacteria sp.]